MNQDSSTSSSTSSSSSSSSHLRRRWNKQQAASAAAIFAFFAIALCAFLPVSSASRGSGRAVRADSSRSGRTAAALGETTGELAGAETEAATVDAAGAADANAPAQQEEAAGAAAEGAEACATCHKGVGDPHVRKVGRNGLSCTDCHGGNATATTKEAAHPKPRFPQKWRGAANPEESFTLLNKESLEWIRFVNPSDLRAVDLACGKCHGSIASTVKKSSMTTSAQVFSTGLYNNGAVPSKDALFAENYSPHGHPQAIRTIPPPTAEQTKMKGVLAMLWPLPRFEIGQPLSVSFLRVFERGGGPKSELGNPNREDVPGQPDESFSNRGFGTQASVDPVILGAQKVRLNDPVMSFMGTNNAPGDYRQSGCASCHVLYANDREVANSGPYARYGNRGETMATNPDPSIRKGEPGHPLEHKFTKAIPSSQCITCHVHNGNGFINSYLGYMWWDEQTDGEYLYPKKQYNPSQEFLDKAGRFNPEESAARGLWWDPKFLETVSGLNPQLRKVQFSDYHGHGWMFRRVYKQDRKGNFLDKDNHVVPFDDPNLYDKQGQPGKAVHLKDIHLERGMHCVDCHFKGDVHGNGNVYGDRRGAIQISCEDCHGTVQKRVTLADLKASGPAAEASGGEMNLTARKMPFNAARFVERDGKLYQRSMVEKNDPATGKLKEWEVVQVLDTITPGNAHYNAKSARAKTIQRDNQTWGQVPADETRLAHTDKQMACIACHTSWTTNCWGCHLSARVDVKKPMLHNEGDETQVYPSYNPQVLRSDGYMLGIDGTVEGHKVMPVRSSSAVTVSVQNAQREQVVNHAATISAAGYNGNAFNTHVPHTVRAQETKTCSDCHVSRNGDNNAWMSSVLMLGTNQVNFMGRFMYAAEGKGGLSATLVAESTEPQAVLGSHLHQIAYPDYYAQHLKRNMKLTENYAHRSMQSNQVQMYGEFLLSAGGPNGFIVYDAANVANKGFSQRIVTTNFSSIGQRLYVDTKDATGVAVGSPAPLDRRRNGPGMSEDQRKWLASNEEQPIAPLFGYAYISDRVEGLITVDISTLSDGVNTNNHLQRAATYNPEGRLSGARFIQIVGNYAYILTDRGLAVVRISDPTNPQWVGEVTSPLRSPRALAVQFRYCFVTDADGLKVLDVTDLEHPQPVASASVALRDARGIYLAREYAYVADGADGLAIIDISRPEQPKLDQTFNAGGQMNDTYDVKVGMSYASLTAYVADGKNGMKVIELTNPNTVPGNLGYSPRPAPRLISYYPTKNPAIQVSEGYRRDRGVDESGNQISVFGRRGARPFNFEEQRRMYTLGGKLFTVTDEPEGGPATGSLDKKAPEGWLQSFARLFSAYLGVGWMALFIVCPVAAVRRKKSGDGRRSVD